MTVFASVNDPEIARFLQAGGVGVVRTDTLYGLVGRADDEAAVRRIYAIKGRDDDKSPIVLIDSVDQLYDSLLTEHHSYANEAWPGPVSIIMPSTLAPSWIRRGNDSVAYRLPAVESLRTLIRQTGPLIAPSANPQGMQPARNLTEARYYFGDTIDFYVEGGTVEDMIPSRIVRFEADGSVTRLR